MVSWSRTLQQCSFSTRSRLFFTVWPHRRTITSACSPVTSTGCSLDYSSLYVFSNPLGPRVPELTSIAIALQTILALLCRFRCCHPWFGDLFLECRTYVPYLFKQCMQHLPIIVTSQLKNKANSIPVLPTTLRDDTRVSTAVPLARFKPPASLHPI